jgi:hypothetical protein
MIQTTAPQRSSRRTSRRHVSAKQPRQGESMNHGQLDQLDPIRCYIYIMEIPEEASIYYGRSNAIGRMVHSDNWR